MKRESVRPIYLYITYKKRPKMTGILASEGLVWYTDGSKMDLELYFYFN